jgi:hypothetical protein
MMYILACDLLVTAATVTLLSVYWRTFHSRGYVLRLGWRIAVLAHLALLVSIVTRMAELELSTAWPARNGYPFAVLGRVGLFLTLIGLALVKRDEGQSDQKTQVCANGVHETSFASRVPPRFHT